MSKEQAKRFDCGVRYDLFDPDAMEAMAKVMCAGSAKYGDSNWKKGLTGEHSGINHALKHCMEYLRGDPNDYGEIEMHMAQVMVNAMFEFHFAKKARLAKSVHSMDALQSDTPTSDMVRNFCLFLAAHDVVGPMAVKELQGTFIARWEKDKCVTVHSHYVFIGMSHHPWYQTLAPGQIDGKWGIENTATAAAINSYINQKET